MLDWCSALTTSASGAVLQFEAQNLTDHVWHSIHLRLSSGESVLLPALHRFGFNTGSTMVDGLWGADPLVVDFAAVVLRQKLLGGLVQGHYSGCEHAICACMTCLKDGISISKQLRPIVFCLTCARNTYSRYDDLLLYLPAGFNAVRLPFSFRDLHDLAPRPFLLDAPRPSDAAVAASVLPPGALSWHLDQAGR